jgi:predicted anti-sigma-YlaC factor YlaD
MTCKDFLKILNDYIDGEVDPSICKDLETHLKDCNPCKVVIDQVRKTITFYKEGMQYPVPLEFRRRLHKAIKDKWKKQMAEKQRES